MSKYFSKDHKSDYNLALDKIYDSMIDIGYILAGEHYSNGYMYLTFTNGDYATMITFCDIESYESLMGEDDDEE